MRQDIPDTLRLKALDQRSLDYIYTKPDSGIYFAQLMYQLAEQIERSDFMIMALFRQGVAYFMKRDYEMAMELGEKCLAMAEEKQDQKKISIALSLTAAVSQERGDYRKAIDYYFRSLQLAEIEKDEMLVAIMSSNIGLIYAKQGNQKKAIEYFSDAYEYFGQQKGNQLTKGEILGFIGLAYRNHGDYPKALEYYQRGLDTLQSINSERKMGELLMGIGETYRGLSSFQEAFNAYQQGLLIFQKIDDAYGLAVVNLGIGTTRLDMGKYAAAVRWCHKALEATTKLQNLAEQKDACDCLYQGYRALGQYKDALIYHEKKTLLLDSLQLQETDKKFQQMEFDRALFEDSLQHIKELEIMDLEIGKHKAEISRQRIGLASVLGGLILVGLLAFFVYRGKKRSDTLAGELEISNHQLAESLNHLQQTQEQLILQEKMASLGQVTMGIAHEIKNPLNFVNNYAQVSVELADELEEEFTQHQEALAEDVRTVILEIIQDLRENSQVIRKNGQRADSIVSSMRNHANDNRGQRSEVEINELIKK
ncbi:MAG: tetratricopeptide repeat protein [Bacteroidia bacterium]